MAFFQDPPELGNQYDGDRVLRAYLQRKLPPDQLREVEPELREMGELAGGELYELQQLDRLNEPRIEHWHAWGTRVDRIELTDVWKRAAIVAAERGVVATAYERKHGPSSRLHQFALAYLFDPSTDVYSCPLAMTDGAATTLREHNNNFLCDRALPRLMSRDPATCWISGQWMTERIGGSDVGLSETEARPATDERLFGQPDAHRLYGTKFFTSAANAQMALTLGRVEGADSGGRGLTLFYLETEGAHGNANGILFNRLKDKLGTRKLPTAELTLEGTLALPVAGLGNGVRNITPMLNITRTWNAICSVAGMRRGLALARDYAPRRVQFKAPLSQQPLHNDTLAGVQAEFEAAFGMAFRVAELIGQIECGEASEHEKRLLRMLTPVAKLTTAKQCVAASSEIIECFGGAGYMEDTGLPRLLRDAQTLPIWEGTTNVLSLDLLRAIRDDPQLLTLSDELTALGAKVQDSGLGVLMTAAKKAIDHAKAWLIETAARAPIDVEAGAPRFSLTVGRGLELALLASQAQWSLDQLNDPRPKLAANRFLRHGVDLISTEEGFDRTGSARLANDD